jgi:AcrR family transcriptional regulator
MTTRPTARKRLTAEERRAEILVAASEVFAEQGYHGSSIDDIAGSAGISKALIYEHFGSKNELFLSLIGLHAGELFERLAEGAGGDAPGAERLERGLAIFFSFVEERRAAWRMMFREAADPDVGAALERIVEAVTALVADLIAADPSMREVQGDEGERRQAVEMLAQLLVGAVQSLANWAIDHEDLPQERLVGIVMEFAWLGMERLQAGERWPDTGG